MLYILNLYIAVCQLYLTKTRKRNSNVAEVQSFICSLLISFSCIFNIQGKKYFNIDFFLHIWINMKWL